jgi:hypothetical protein
VDAITFHYLEILEIDYCTITNGSMKALLQNAPSLTYLNASYIQDLTSLQIQCERLLALNAHDNYQLEELLVSGNNVTSIYFIPFRLLIII